MPHQNLHRQSRRSTNARRGFSLLELTLVLVILGVLGAVAAVNVLGAGERAKESATKTSMRTVRSQIEAYQLQNNAYPTTLQTLVDGRFLEAKSIKDSWGNAFIYRAPGYGGNPFELYSQGADGEGGTDDDISVWALDAE